MRLLGKKAKVQGMPIIAGKFASNRAAYLFSVTRIASDEGRVLDGRTGSLSPERCHPEAAEGAEGSHPRG
jgi:hypothetical protein